MADIRIQKKKPVWPWVVGILLGLLIIWILVRVFDRERQIADIEEPEVQNEEGAGVPEEVNEYLLFVSESDTIEERRYERSHVVRGIQSLSAALEVVSKHYRVAGIGVSRRGDRLRAIAKYIQQYPSGEVPSDSIHTAFIQAADWMEEIQVQRFPRLEIYLSEVKNAAGRVDSERQVDEQVEKIKAFFRASGNFIREIVFQEQDVLVMNFIYRSGSKS